MLSRIATSVAFAITAIAAFGTSACSSSDSNTLNPSSGTAAPPKANERIGDIRENDTWKNGYKLTGLIAIHESSTVEIEPGATITCTDAVQIQVGGTLRVKAGGARVKISCPLWRGILVATNGTVDLSNIDLENPEVGIESSPGAKSVTISDSSITNSPRPFLVREQSTITATKVKATTPTTMPDGQISVSEVFGTFIAKYLDYQANTSEGVMVQAGGVGDISDSTMNATQGFDLISSYGAASLKVSYTTMAGAHCGIHVAGSHEQAPKPTVSAEIDHVTSEENLFGITIYAAEKATVTSSNFAGKVDWLDLQGGPWPGVSFSNTFAVGAVNQPQGAPAKTSDATTKIADAHPR